VLEGVKKALVDEVIIDDEVICGHTCADRDKRDSRFGWRQGPHWVRFGRNGEAIAIFRLLRAAMSELIGAWFVTHPSGPGACSAQIELRRLSWVYAAWWYSLITPATTVFDGWIVGC